MTTRAVLTPTTPAAGGPAGKRLWWKQLLPLGAITYQGRKLTFDRPYLTDLAASFQARAYDLVPAVLADSDNRHNMDPARMRGEVRQVEVREDGLYGLVDLADDAAELVARHPQFGVSVRIVEDLHRADGKRFPRALQHVLLTADPRVTGMRPWATVDLSTDPTPVLDLSAGQFTTEKEPLVASLTADQIGALRALLATTDSTPDPTTEPVDPTPAPTPQPADPPANPPVTAPDPNPTPAPTPQADLDDAELDALVTALTTRTPATAGAELSTPVQPAGEAARIAALELSVARSSWNEERSNWVAAGVPPVMLDRAAPLLSVPARGQVDLSNGTTLDPFAIVRSVLDAAKGTVDLSAPRGTSVTPEDLGDGLDITAIRQSAAYTNWSF